MQFYSPPFQTIPYPPNAGTTCTSAARATADAAGTGEGAPDDAYAATVAPNAQGDLSADAEDAAFTGEGSDDDESGGAPGPALPSNAEACTSASGRATRAEIGYCFTEPNAMPGPAAIKRRDDCRTAFSAANLAAEQAERRFGKLARDGYVGNAFQHCAWNARMVQRFDSFAKARKFADDLHESDSTPGPDLEMDLFNNGRGRSIGANETTGRGAYNECESAHGSGISGSSAARRITIHGEEAVLDRRRARGSDRNDPFRRT